jgi:hypothetical protein
METRTTSMKLMQKFKELERENRPQDPFLDGIGLRFETMERGGEYPDTIPQAIKLIDAEGRTCICVPITQNVKVRPRLKTHSESQQPPARDPKVQGRPARSQPVIPPKKRRSPPVHAGGFSIAPASLGWRERQKCSSPCFRCTTAQPPTSRRRTQGPALRWPVG